MTEPSCKELLIPPRLWLYKGAGNKKFNDGAEYLYRRFPPNIEITPEGRLSGATIKGAISPPFDISCNRSSLSDYATDVLYNIKELPHRFHYGVIEATVESLKGRIIPFREGKELLSLRFDIEHTPEKCMYPHSEITVYKNEIKLDKASKTIKTLIRDELAKVFIVCHHPDPTFSPTEKVKRQTFLVRAKQLLRKLIRIDFL